MRRQPASKRRAPASAPRWAQAGVGLIEVLVAALVLAVGILGIAALQTKALASSGDAMGRSMATIATYSIIDAMSLDASNAKKGSYNGTVTANACPAPGTLAQTALNDWCTSLAQNLGGAATTQGTVNCDSTGACTVTIQWTAVNLRDGASSPSTGTTEKLITQAQVSS